MTREERSVFPAISRMEKTGTPGASGPLAEQIEALVTEHTVVGDLFKEINSVTSGYAVPEDGCASYRMMVDGLQEMELDLHAHIHKEKTCSSRERWSWSAHSPATDGPPGSKPPGGSCERVRRANGRALDR